MRPTFLYGNSQADGSGDTFYKARTEEEFEDLCKCLGWISAEAFYKSTRNPFNAVVDRWFLVVRNCVYLNIGKDGEFPIYETEIPESFLTNWC